jgi:hypothetical protein
MKKIKKWVVLYSSTTAGLIEGWYIVLNEIGLL